VALEFTKSVPGTLLYARDFALHPFPGLPFVFFPTGLELQWAGTVLYSSWTPQYPAKYRSVELNRLTQPENPLLLSELSC
jgi:hypothetical protein